MGNIIELKEQKSQKISLDHQENLMWDTLASDTTPHVVIYTDGACSGNPGPGGWGVVFQYNSLVAEDFGGEALTTNNRMEMMAAIQGLEKIKNLEKNCTIDLYTDSKYVRDGIQSWMVKWKQNGWHTSDKKPVKNKDLWEVLDHLQQHLTITWHWVKGHAGNPLNEKADDLARSAVVRQALKG